MPAPRTVVNVGSGFDISIGDTARLIAELIGVAAEIEEDKARLRPAESEVDRLLAATDRARDLLRWTPAYGGREGFRRGLAETIAWFSEPANLAHYRTREYTL